MRITYAALWDGPLLTEGSHRVTSTPGQDPAWQPMAETADLTPPKGRLFSDLRLPFAFLSVWTAGYIRVDIEDAGSRQRTLYGWVDQVREMSDDDASPLVSVSWHIDSWRTFGAGLNYNRSVLRRCGDRVRDEFGLTNEPQNISYINLRPWEHAVIRPIYDSTMTPEIYSILEAERVLWFAVICSVTDSNKHIVGTRVMACPVATKGERLRVVRFSMTSGGQAANCLTLDEVISGSWDELLGLAPDEVISAYLTPYPPTDDVTMTKSGSDSSVLLTVTGGLGWTPQHYGTSEKRGMLMREPYFAKQIADVRLSESIFDALHRGPRGTDDKEELTVVSPMGDVLGTLPWGIRTDSCFIRQVWASEGSYTEICFVPYDLPPGPGGWTRDDYITALRASGMVITVPMVNVGVTDNAWSDYMLSGARAADIEQMRLDADRTRNSAVLGAGASAVNGAMTGALVGMAGGPVGAGAGAAVGLVTSLASAGANDYLTRNEYNPRQQQLRDFRAAEQTNGLRMAGSGFELAMFGVWGCTVQIMQKVRNGYIEYIDEFGREFSPVPLTGEQTARAMTLAMEGQTPLQLEGLSVTGAPTEACREIERMMERGVRFE